MARNTPAARDFAPHGGVVADQEPTHNMAQNFPHYGFDSQDIYETPTDSDSCGDASDILTPSTHSYIPLSPAAAPFSPAYLRSPETLNHEMDAIGYMRPSLPTRFHSTSTVPNLAEPDQTSEIMRSLTTVSPAWPLRAFPTAAHPQSNSTSSSCALPKTLEPNPLYMFHTLNSPPDLDPFLLSGLRKPKVPPVDTPDPSMDIAAEVRNLKHLYNCQSTQLAAHEHTINRLSGVNDALWNMRERDINSIDDLSEALTTQTRSAGGLQKRVEDLEKGLKHATSELEGVTKAKAVTPQAEHDLTTGIKLKIENVCEMQKVQSTSISAVAGQVGSLEKLLQGTSDGLGKEVQTMSTAASEQAQNFKDLSKDFQDLKERFEDEISYRAHHDEDQEKLVDEQGDEISALRSTVSCLREEVKEVVHDIGREFVEIKEQSRRSLVVDDAHAVPHTAVEEEWNEMKVSLSKLQASVSGMQKRVKLESTGRDTALKDIREEIAEGTRRADEAVAVADARAAGADAEITKLRNKIEKLEARSGDAGRDRVSEVALDHIDAELAALRTATDSLAKTCELPDNIKDETLASFMTATISKEVEKVQNDHAQDMMNMTKRQDDSTCKTQTLKGIIDDLSRGVAASKVEQDAKIADATADSSRHDDLIYEAIGRVAALEPKVDEALAVHGGQITALTQGFASTGAEFKKQVSALETRLDAAASMEDILPRIQAARDASQAEDREIVTRMDKELKRVDAPSIELSKEVEARLNSEIGLFTRDFNDLRATSSNLQRQVDKGANASDELARRLHNLDQTVLDLNTRVTNAHTMRDTEMTALTIHMDELKAQHESHINNHHRATGLPFSMPPRASAQPRASDDDMEILDHPIDPFFEQDPLSPHNRINVNPALDRIASRQAALATRVQGRRGRGHAARFGRGV